MNRNSLSRQFNDKLDEIIGEDLPLLKKVKKFVVSSGGKRIRPITHYYFSMMLGYKGREWADVGAIGEIIHAASLLHDDVIDDAGIRRGKPTMNALFGNKSSILSGDFLLACGLEHLMKLPMSGPLLMIFTRVLRELSTGELLQMQWESDVKIPDPMYERIIHCKTGSLFGAMTESAAVLSGSGADEAARCRQFGEIMGRVFQIRDDFIDYFGDESANGKELFQDYRRGIVTRPVILLRKEISFREKKALEDMWNTPARRLSGQDMFFGLFEKKNIRKKLAVELETEIHKLMHFVRGYSKSQYTDDLMEALRALMVPVQ